MSQRTRSSEIGCDAPAYQIVRACTECGFQSPLDVRWCHVGGIGARAPRRPGKGGTGGGFLSRILWRLWRTDETPVSRCTCGEALPKLKRCVFLLNREKQGDYLLAQCPRCHTMFWEFTSVAPAPMDSGVVS